MLGEAMRGTKTHDLVCMWVVAKIMAPFWVLIVMRYLGDPKTDHSFDNHPYVEFCLQADRGP